MGLFRKKTKQSTEFEDFRLLKPGTKVLIKAKVKNSTVMQKNGDIKVWYTLSLQSINEPGRIPDIIEVYRTLDEIECNDLSKYSDEELKQELLKREALKSGGLSGYDIT